MIAIVSGHNKVDNIFIKYNKTFIEEYCEVNGYDFYNFLSKDYKFVVNQTNNAQFYYAKYNHVLKVIRDYEYVLWLDSDVLIINPEVSLENAYSLDNNQDVEFFISPDIARTLNAGVMLFKNTRRIQAFLEHMTYAGISDLSKTHSYDKLRKTYSPNYDQYHIEQYLFNYTDELLAYTKFMPPNIYNASPQTDYWGAPIDETYDRNAMTLFYHLYGVPTEERYNIAKKVYNNENTRTL